MIVRPRLLAGLALVGVLAAGSPRGAGADEVPLLEAVARASRAAVAVVRSTDRVGESRGAGTGFFVARKEPGGDAASPGDAKPAPRRAFVTNLHVVGEGRPFEVETPDGARLRPERILAFDREKDLAVLELAPHDVPALELGDSRALAPGQAVLAVGNSLGLGLGVLTGTFSEARELEGRRLLQLAMPIEPGSSGSPVLTASGKVVGVVAIKTGTTTGFAVPVEDVRALLESERPMPFARWQRLGALDETLWRQTMGGDWRQRAGKIVGSGQGSGFGGRMLCLSERPPPGPDFDLAVEVRLGDESGAAGLAFHADGGDAHYGFYPTAGSLRLTRFQGPDVFSWTILSTVASDAYRPGAWNEIRVRVRGQRISCAVNGRTVIDLEDGGLPPGKVGLVKFREPRAELRRFRIAPELPAPATDAELASRLDDLVPRLAAAPQLPADALEALAGLGEPALRALEDRARQLEAQATRLRSAARQAREGRAVESLRTALDETAGPADLLRASLRVARLDNEDVEEEPYAELLDRWAEKARPLIEARAAGKERLEALLATFVDELGFRGSGLEYYHRSNSYVNEVIDDREGIPITLTIVFLELARRVGLPVVGLGTPQHFLARYVPEGGEPQLIDVYGGKLIDDAAAAVLCGRALTDLDLEPQPPRRIVGRMLRNLLGAAEREGDVPAVLRYLDAVIAVGPEAETGGERWIRAVMRFRAAEPATAEPDLLWLLEHDVPGVNRADVEELLGLIRRQRDR